MLADYVPRLVRLDATWICNLNCKHCQTAMFRGPDHPDDLSTDRLLSLFAELAELGTKYLGLLGGEPLVRHDLRALLESLSSLQIHTSITTNGILLPRTASVLAEHAFAVAVSFDGPDAETHDFVRGPGTFDKARAGMEALVQARGRRKAPSIGLSTVIHQGNAGRATEFFRLAKETDADYLIIASVHPVGNAVKHWDALVLSPTELFEVGERLAEALVSDQDPLPTQINFFTPAFREYIRTVRGLAIPQILQVDHGGLYECYIQSDGQVFPNQRFSEMVPEVLAGSEDMDVFLQGQSIRERPFADIWLGRAFERYRRYVTARDYLRGYETCSQCAFAKTHCTPTAGSAVVGEANPQPICVDAHRHLRESRGALA